LSPRPCAAQISSEVGVLGSLLAKREWTLLFKRQLTYALWAVPAAATTALQKYSREQTALCLRDQLQRKLHEGLGAAAGDAPGGPYLESEQPLRSLPLALSVAAGSGPEASRGGAVNVCVVDPRDFCSATVELYEALTKPLLEVTLLSIKLSMMMGPGQLVRCYSFFIAAGCWTRFAGPSIATMTATVAEAEADLLGQHSHLAEYAEEVAMIGGGQPEATAMQSALATVTGRTSRLQLQRFGSDSLDGYVLRHLGILSAFTAMLPAVVAAAPATGMDPTEYFLTSLHLLVNVGMACKDLVLSHKTAAAASAHAKRIQTLFATLEGHPQPPAIATAASTSPALLTRSLSPADSSVLRLTDVVIGPPGHSTALTVPLKLSVPNGARVLACGPNGCGKSSLLRVILGVWLARSGEVATPPAAEIFALPQRAYVLSTGSVQAQLVYPATPATAPTVTDAELLESLQWAGLDHLASSPPDLRTPRPDLSTSLSGGERQRLAAARLYLACCGARVPPTLVLLDEPTSACEPSFEARLFAFIALKELSTVVVAHRMDLAKYHTHELIFNGRGDAVMRKL
jgi:ABC-type uncharacterized transport system fused permease/ATPase subunit